MKFIEIYPGMPTIQDWQDYNSYIMFEGVSIKLFQTKIDYLLNQNTYFQGTTDEKGRLYIDDKSDLDTLWCRTTYDTLNNLRFGDIEFVLNDLKSRSDKTESTVISMRLSNTPTKLQINVTNNGIPVDSAVVQLYTSQDFMVNEMKPQENLLLMTGNVYGRWEEVTEWFINDSLKPIFCQTTDKDGVAWFDNLEPRAYWFTVSKGPMNNSSGIVTTDGPLPDDPDLTTNMTINIQ